MGNDTNKDTAAQGQASADAQTSTVVDPTKLQKSWNDALEELRKSTTSAVIEDDTQPLQKAKKTAKDDDEGEDDEEDDVAEDEEGEEGGKGKGKDKMKKSLDELIAEDPEASAAMDIEPYLKSFAKGVDKLFTSKVKSLEKSVKDLTKIVLTQSKAMISSMEMQKSLDDKVQKIGETPIPPVSQLKKSGTGRFSVGEGDAKQEMTREEIMTKALDLCNIGKISSTDVTIIEGRLNKGQELPANVQVLLKGGK